MPELPEVEVTRRGVAPHLEGRVVDSVVLRREGLRWPFPPDLNALLAGRRVLHTGRRGKYLLIAFEHGTLIVHLGMSGHLRVIPPATELKKHDHFDLIVDGPDGKQALRLHDPRRFGAVVYAPDESAPMAQKLLGHLGVEPLSDDFDPHRFYAGLHARGTAVKQVLLGGELVVGVGNIYCSEALFGAGIRPTLAASRISRPRAERLWRAIREVLARAVAAGGSTLRDFQSAEGQSGHFQLQAMVYGREGLPCHVCATPIRAIRQGQRSTFFCPHCQKS